MCTGPGGPVQIVRPGLGCGTNLADWSRNPVGFQSGLHGLAGTTVSVDFRADLEIHSFLFFFVVITTAVLGNKKGHQRGPGHGL